MSNKEEIHTSFLSLYMHKEAKNERDKNREKSQSLMLMKSL